MRIRNFKKENSLLLVIDIQAKLVGAIDGKDLLIKNAKTLITGIKTFGIPIIFTEQYPKGLGHTLEELESLSPESEVIEKTSFSAVNTDFINKLNEYKAENIIICGTETHICVYQTALDLLEEGFNVYVPIETVGSRTKENKENGLNLMAKYGANISNKETILFEILKDKNAEEFKTISKLII